MLRPFHSPKAFRLQDLFLQAGAEPPQRCMVIFHAQPAHRVFLIQPFTTIYYESPHRIKETLQVMLEILGNRRVVIARELTKQYEEFIRGTIQEILEVADELRGEMVVIVEGTTEKKEEVVWWQDLDIIEHVNYYIEQGHSPNESIKRVAKERKLAKNEVYRTFHIN